MQKLALIALAGALGTLTRYGLDGFIQQLTEKRPPFGWGIVVVNLSGCLVFGVLAAAFERWAFSSETRIVVLTGFLGAFTTFSTYMFETAKMLQAAQWWPAIGYFTIHNAGGLAAILAGLAVGRLL